MVHVFISHSGKENDFAKELANFLEEGGEIKTFVDDHDIRPGEHFVSRIESGLHTDAVVVVLSPGALRAEWVEREWKRRSCFEHPSRSGDGPRLYATQVAFWREQVRCDEESAR